MLSLVPSQSSTTFALSLVEKLRESGRHGEAEWKQYRACIDDLLKTLKHEPLTFEDAFATYLVDEEWTAREAWDIAKQAAREVSTKHMREALEHEYYHAGEMLAEYVRPRDYEGERAEQNWEMKRDACLR